MMKRISLAVCLVLGTTGGAYAAGDVEAGKAKSATCAGCHGPDGNSKAFLFPKLAGQNERYALEQLKAFKSGDRVEPQMVPMVTPLTEEDMVNLGAYYATQTVTEAPAASGGGDQEAGRKLYKGGNPANGLAACASCHGPTATGNPGAGYPALKGQFYEYTVKQLSAFKAGSRGGAENATANAKMMYEIAAKLTDEDVKSVAAYLTSVK